MEFFVEAYNNLDKICEYGPAKGLKYYEILDLMANGSHLQEYTGMTYVKDDIIKDVDMYFRFTFRKTMSGHYFKLAEVRPITTYVDKNTWFEANIYPGI